MISIMELTGLPVEKILNRDIQSSLPQIDAAVDAILADVRENGDAALRKYARQFDGVELEALAVTEEEIDTAMETVDADFLVFSAKDTDWDIKIMPSTIHHELLHHQYVIMQIPMLSTYQSNPLPGCLGGMFQ